MEKYNNPTINSIKNRNSSFQTVISDPEKSIIKEALPYDQESISDYLDAVERARVKRARISAKTQRKEKSIIDINVHEGMTTMNYHFSHVNGTEPPDRTGKGIYGFSDRSRYRMMKKAKTMKRGELGLPYFVTLTYHRNMKDFKKAKQNLNAFFQRFRRIATEDDPFKYMWKMEPQKRGAIHFHLMLFIPENLFPDGYTKNESCKLEYVRMRVSAAWNEIAEPGDNQHLQAGTNVRSVNNWRMATGYLAKYMGKNVKKFKGKKLMDRKQFKKFGKKRGYRHFWFDLDNKNKPRWEYVHKRKKVNTGRFWGFSNNFDFKPYYRHTVDMQKVEEIRILLKEICDASFEEFKMYAKKRLSQLKAIKKSNPKKYKYGVLKLKKQLKNQRRRYVINLEKIEKGASVQADLSHVVAREIIPETIHYN